MPCHSLRRLSQASADAAALLDLPALANPPLANHNAERMARMKAIAARMKAPAAAAAASPGSAAPFSVTTSVPAVAAAGASPAAPEAGVPASAVAAALEVPHH